MSPQNSVNGDKGMELLTPILLAPNDESKNRHLICPKLLHGGLVQEVGCLLSKKPKKGELLIGH